MWRIGLFYKLLKTGVGVKLVSILKDLYIKTNNRVKVDGFLSNMFQSHTGTRQGCNLSPTIFNLYINDIPQYLRMKGGQPVLVGSMKINILMYADDILLL